MECHNGITLGNPNPIVFCAHNVVANLVLCLFFEYSADLNKCEFTESDKFAIFFFDNG